VEKVGEGCHERRGSVMSSQANKLYEECQIVEDERDDKRRDE